MLVCVRGRRSREVVKGRPLFVVIKSRCCAGNPLRWSGRDGACRLQPRSVAGKCHELVDSRNNFSLSISIFTCDYLRARQLAQNAEWQRSTLRLYLAAAVTQILYLESWLALPIEYYRYFLQLHRSCDVEITCLLSSDSNQQLMINT